jgi:GrpB-like predicted nucleotidyltransferase (UPF0157 family)
VTSTEDRLRAVTIGGVQRLDSQIRLIEYDSDWPRLYEREAERLRSVLGDRVLQLEHVGSTSVPGLCAKPLIDMLLVVTNTAEEATYVPDMEAAGYVLRIREPDWYEHRMFKGPDTDINMHAFSYGCVEIERMLRFRNWLRANSADRTLYARRKRELAQQTWEFTQDYADAKSAVVEDILTRAC